MVFEIYIIIKTNKNLNKYILINSDADLLMDNSRNKKSNDYEDLKNKSDHNNLSEKNNNKANQNKNIGNIDIFLCLYFSKNLFCFVI